MLEFTEHSLDAIAVFVAAVVGMFGQLAVRAGRDDWQDAAHEQAFPEPVAVIALVGEQPLGLG